MQARDYKRGGDPELIPLIERMHKESQARDTLRKLAKQSEEKRIARIQRQESKSVK